MKVLKTGRADYIGSHITLGLIDRNIDVVVSDNLLKGFEKFVHKKSYIY